jgi:hypothetical protein
MGRPYTGQVSAVTLPATNAFDVFELTAPSDACLVIHSIFVGQAGTADYGDAEAEGLTVQLKRASGSFTSGSGGTTPTPAPHSFGDAATGATLEASNTTIAAVGTGALTVLRSETFNVQAGWYYTPTPEERIVLSPGQALVVSIPVGPADAFSALAASITFEEQGG